MTAPPPSSGTSPRSVSRPTARVLAAVAALVACLATAPAAHATGAETTTTGTTVPTVTTPAPATTVAADALTVPTVPTVPTVATVPAPAPAKASATAHRHRKRRHAKRKRHHAAAPRRAHATGGCPSNVGDLTTRHSILQAQRRMLCLMNHERARFGLPPLHSNRCLHRVAARHAHDMVHRHYFAHTTPNGWDPGQRARASGYVPRAAAWIVGENIAWGVGGAATAGWVFTAWMHSPPHRHNILSRAFHDVGIGVSRGVPVHGFRGYHLRATFSVEFGAHHGRTRCGA